MSQINHRDGDRAWGARFEAETNPHTGRTYYWVWGTVAERDGGTIRQHSFQLAIRDRKPTMGELTRFAGRVRANFARHMREGEAVTAAGDRRRDYEHDTDPRAAGCEAAGI